MGPRSGLPSADGARVVIADGDRLFATTLTAALERHEDFEVVGVAGDGAEAVALAEDLKPSVIVMDSAMPVLDGFEATRRIRELPDPPAVVLMAGEDAPGSDPRMSSSGASAYVRKAEVLSVIDVIVGLTQLRHGIAIPIPVSRALPELHSSRRT